MTIKLPQVKKERKLSRKEQGFVNDYVDTDNATQSALKNYDTTDYSTAGNIGSENLNKPRIIEAIDIARISLKEALINKGITPNKIADKVNVLLNAKDIKGQTDFTAIDKGLKHATAIYGIEDPNNKPPTQNTYNFLFSPEVQADVKELEAKIKARLVKPNVQKPI